MGGREKIRPAYADQRDGLRGERRRLHGDIVARPALQRANTAEAFGLYFYRRADTGARHWRQHGALQRGQCGSAAPLALRGAEAIGAALRGQLANGL